MARLSVVVPARDAAATIGACLDSVFAQTRVPDEVVVVDDGSGDATADIAASYAPRVRVLRQTRRGAAAARNAGAAQTAGDLLFFCDADLLLEPRLFERLEGALEARPDAQFAYCGFRWGNKTFGMRSFDADAVKRNNYISTMSLIRRAAFPGFDETLSRFQDWDLWLTMLERGARGVGVQEVLFSVQQDGTMSRRGGFSRMRATRRVRRKHGLRMRASDVLVALKESFASFLPGR